MNNGGKRVNGPPPLDLLHTLKIVEKSYEIRSQTKSFLKSVRESMRNLVSFFFFSLISPLNQKQEIQQDERQLGENSYTLHFGPFLCLNHSIVPGRIPTILINQVHFDKVLFFFFE